MRLDGDVTTLVFPDSGEARVAYSPTESEDRPAVRVVMDHPRAAEIELRSVEPLTFTVRPPPPPRAPEEGSETPP